MFSDKGTKLEINNRKRMPGKSPKYLKIKEHSSE